MSRRQNGFGTLVSKGAGKPWLARWCYEGKIYTKSTGEADKQKALKVLEKLTRPFREDTKIEVLRSLEAKVKSAGDLAKEQHSMKLSELQAAYEQSLCAKDITSSTLHIYSAYIKSLTKWLAANTRCKTMKDVKRSDAEAYLLDICKKISPDHYNIKLVFFKKLWSMFAEEAGLSENIWLEFKKLKTSKASCRRPFSREELLKILDAARSDPSMVLMVALGIYTGMRMGDCATLKWKDVCFERNVLSVIPQKTKRHMTMPIEIPIHSSLKKILESWLLEKDCNSGYVCEQNAVDYLNGRLGKKVKLLLEKCGIETTAKDELGRMKIVHSFHCMRHTFVSLAIENGMSPFLVSKIVGHSSTAMTEHYWHTNVELARESINKLPELSVPALERFGDAS